MTAPEQINSSEAAKILGVSQAWVAALCRAKSLKAERGSGQGSPWRIEKSSVDELAAQRSHVDKETFEEVVKEIAGDKEARQFAAAKAEESFVDRVVTIAKRYGFGVLLLAGGIAAKVFYPESDVGNVLMNKGADIIWKAWNSPPSLPLTVPLLAGVDIPALTENNREGPPDIDATAPLLAGVDNPRPTEKIEQGPPDIDARPTDEIMAAFRQATRGRGALEREELLKEVSVLLGYKRLGPRIEEALRGHLRAAIRRKIIESEGTQVRASTTTMADYALDDLREAFVSVMRIGTRYEREDVIRAIASYLGFSNLTTTIQDAMKSAFNSGIRQGLLDAEGSSVIWRKS